jgi:sugar O-acyltransferase (sialic acid O-acetyltransferase NeuD family)
MKKRIAFIGSGELSLHIAHYVIEDNQYEVVGFFDDFTPVGSMVKDYKIIGTLNDIQTMFDQNIFDGLVNGIGFMRMEYRKEVFDRFKGIVPFTNFIHSSCIIDSTSKIGEGVIIFPMAMLYYNAVIEDNVFIQVNTTITDSKICRDTMVSGGVMVAGRSIVGKGCNIGVKTCISNDISICDNVQTGAGAVVVKNITEPGVYIGIPARNIKDKN